MPAECWWTMADVRRACSLRGRGLSYSEIGAILGRSSRQVQRYCYRYHEPPGPRNVDMLPQREGLLRELLARGLHLASIARELRCHPCTVTSYLLRLGLPRPCGRDARSEATRETLATLASEQNRRKCAELGWPEVTVPTQARILSLLEKHGPLDHAGIVSGLGWKLFDHHRRPGVPYHNPGVYRHLRALTTPAAGRRDAGTRAWNERHVKGGLPGLVVRLPGGPPLYRISDWLLARKNEERA